MKIRTFREELKLEALRPTQERDVAVVLASRDLEVRSPRGPCTSAAWTPI